jgi:TRAP-type C4-dicarboxylate transport system permease large subunit
MATPSTIGVNVFAIASMTADASIYDISRGVMPFWIAYLALVVLIIIFPQIALFLLSLM